MGTKEDDAILSDLASRFINRDLLEYIPFDGSIITISELQELFEAGGINPDYYFVSEAFSDLPYDYDSTVKSQTDSFIKTRWYD